jgi:ubiquinone/menaquinone biosynthesis C-methylase UbiE
MMFTTSFAYDSRELAETYDRLSDLQLESGEELVRRMGDLDGARVLDVGCGTGRLARWIASDVVGPSGRVVGVDPLAERIAIARAHARDVRFEVAQAEDLGGFESGSFDAVCMSSVFHWVMDKPRALAETRRVLRPGGRLGVTTISRELGSAGTLTSALTQLLERAPYAGRVGRSELAPARPGLTVTELVTTVLAAGLELSELHVEPRRWRCASGEELALFLESSSFGNLFRIVPEELRGALRVDLVETFEARKLGGEIVVKDWITFLVATRV